jgi:hypothetical protein
MMWNPSDAPICDRAGTGFTARTCTTATIARLSAADSHRGCKAAMV